MKTLLRTFAIAAFSLWLVHSWIPDGLHIPNNWRVFAQAAGWLTVANLIIKPLANLILFPLNLISMGAFRWITQVLILWIATIVVPQFSISGFKFVGIPIIGSIFPFLSAEGLFAYITIAFLLSMVTSFVLWLFS